MRWLAALAILGLVLLPTVFLVALALALAIVASHGFPLLIVAVVAGVLWYVSLVYLFKRPVE